MKLQIGYKVVLPIEGKLMSAVVSSSKFGLEYKIGELTEPKKGTLILAFQNLNLAEQFSIRNKPSNSHQNLEVYESILVDPKPIQFLLNVSTVRNETVLVSSIINQWKEILKNSNTKNNIMFAPEGTIGCSKIQLIKKV